MTRPDILNKLPCQPSHPLLQNWPFTSRVPINQHCVENVAFRFFAVIVVVSTGFTSLCFSNGETDRVRYSVPWSQGERLQYRVSWANFVAAGELTLDCQEMSEPGKPRLYRFGVRARSVDWVRTLILNVNDTYEASVDAETLLPIQAEERLEHGKTLEKTSIRFDHQSKVVRLSNGHSQPLAPNTYDAATLMFILRTLELSSGKTQIVRLLDNETVHTLRAEAEQIESVRVGQKNYQVTRVAIKQVEKGTAQDALKIRLYLTSDPRRVPVLMTAEPAWGTIRVELRE
jgi:Protein of unknown function (DUF3108)